MIYTELSIQTSVWKREKVPDKWNNGIKVKILKEGRI